MTACQVVGSCGGARGGVRGGVRGGLGDVCIEVDDTGACTAWGAAPSAPSSSTWLQNLIGGVFKTGENILTAKTQTKGVLTQTAPGVFTYVQPEGSRVTLPVNVSPAGTLGVNATASSGMGMVLIGGAALLVVFMMAKGKG